MPHTVWQFLGPGSGDAFAEGRRGLSEDQESAIYRGQRLPEPLPDVEIVYLSEGRIGNLIGSSFSAFVVSPAVRALLDPATPVQFVPVRLRRRASGYAIMNLLAHVPCLDTERSDYERMPGHPDRLLAVRRLVLHEIPADAPALFHMAELPGAILVRADLRAGLEALDSVGEFVEVEDFTWGMV
ncbi:MAG TPA: hypothetical protein VMC03_03530 [Streptosporangiaceae bacterium]|nr:hypothetical protein [Streptosporangiaceae bacterium]